MTPLATIQSWSREQLESAFSQRDQQLAKADKDIEKLGAFLTGYEDWHSPEDYANLKAALASSTSAGHSAFEAEHAKVESLEKQNQALREALIGWRNYFQKDIPTTSDQQEAQGEQFTSAWFAMEQALSATPTPDHSNVSTRGEK